LPTGRAEKVKDFQERRTCGKPECLRAFQRKAALLRLGLIKKDNGDVRPVYVWDRDTYPQAKLEFPKTAWFEDDPRAIADLGTPRSMMPEKGFGPFTASSAHAATEGRGMSIMRRGGRGRQS
jgi:hypothetical protein